MFCPHHAAERDDDPPPLCGRRASRERTTLTG